MFDIHEEEQILTIAFYNGGVRVVDLSGLTGISIGGTLVSGAGMKEIGYYQIPDMNTWSAKTPRIAANGDFYLYGNDIARGLDVYKFTAAGDGVDQPGPLDEPGRGAGRGRRPAQGRALARHRLLLPAP